jgi:hypothetical protein
MSSKKQTSRAIPIPVFFPVCCLFIASWCFVLLFGCTTNITDAKIDHEEKLVINGAVIAGQPIRNIHITRSIAPLDTFSFVKVGIRDADARISVDGREVRMRLQAASDSIRAQYGTNLIAGPTAYEAPELIAEAGKTYTLTVNWNGKRASAATTVPAPPQVASLPRVSWRTNIIERTFSAPFGGNPQIYRDTSITAFPQIPMQTRPNEMYSFRRYKLLDTATNTPYESQSYGAFLPAFDTAKKQTVSLGFYAKPDALGRVVIPIFDQATMRVTNTILSTTTTVFVVQLEARDAQIIPFLETSGRLFESQQFNPLGTNGRNPNWNVRGDAIGLFIGQSTTTTVTLRP